jgi:4-hydroxysphinganine ceramide fatty acyl 2-hydroxylase
VDFVLDHERVQRLPDGGVIDWKHGLLAQIGAVGEDYWEWIEHPKLGRCRLFDSDFLESLTFTPWWVVPALYIPWGLLELRESVVRETSEIFNRADIALTLFAIGVLMWSLTEYVYHRYAFHWVPWSHASRMVHFMAHGLHHLTPADEFRLVFPPVVSVPLALLHRRGFYALFPIGASAALLGGYLVGYTAYESTHYFIHHCPSGAWLKARFYYHSKHHFDPRKRDAIYGVSSQLWDAVFGSL